MIQDTTSTNKEPKSESNKQRWMNFYRFLRDRRCRKPPTGDVGQEQNLQYYKDEGKGRMTNHDLKTYMLADAEDIQTKLRDFNREVVFYHH